VEQEEQNTRYIVLKLTRRTIAVDSALRSVVHSPSLFPRPHLAAPPLMPNIQDLPLEVIGQVVSIAYPGEPPADGDEWRARRRFLRATSLVCRDWTPFAQAELWKFVHLRWEEADRFHAAGPGRHPVLTLALDQDIFSDTGLAKEILLGVRGVRKLEIMFGQFDSGCLCGPGFRGWSRPGYSLQY
jgi:hypothetical protein